MIVGRGDPRVPPASNWILPTYHGFEYLDVDTGDLWTWHNESGWQNAETP